MAITLDFQSKDEGSIPSSRSIMAYSVTVSTKHFDCFSPGSNPGKPAKINKYYKNLVFKINIILCIT